MELKLFSTKVVCSLYWLAVYNYFYHQKRTKFLYFIQSFPFVQSSRQERGKIFWLELQTVSNEVYSLQFVWDFVDLFKTFRERMQQAKDCKKRLWTFVFRCIEFDWLDNSLVSCRGVVIGENAIATNATKTAFLRHQIWQFDVTLHQFTSCPSQFLWHHTELLFSQKLNLSWTTLLLAHLIYQNFHWKSKTRIPDSR